MMASKTRSTLQNVAYKHVAYVISWTGPLTMWEYAGPTVLSDGMSDYAINLS